MGMRKKKGKRGSRNSVDSLFEDGVMPKDGGKFTDAEFAKRRVSLRNKESLHKQLQKVMKWKEMGLITDEQFVETKREITELISMKKSVKERLTNVHSHASKNQPDLLPPGTVNRGGSKTGKKVELELYHSDSSGSWETDSE